MTLVLLTACGGGPDAVYTFETETNSLSADVVGDRSTDSETVTWTNNGAQAEVSLSLDPDAAGGAEVTVRDAGGTVVPEGQVDSLGDRAAGGR